MSRKWLDHNGVEIPAKYVPATDKIKDRFAQKMLKKANDINKKLSDFKIEILSSADKIYMDMLKDANVKASARKGNYTITSFDKSIKVEVKMSLRIEFDDNITFAQDKINEFLRVKTDGIDNDLSELVNSAFTTTKGTLDTKRILSLFALKITHKLWIEAMELIKKSISTNVSKRYVNIWIKDDNGEYQNVQLNFSSI